MIRVKWIGLVNLVAGRALVPELIQGEATGERIAEEALRILGDEKLRREMIAGLAEVREKLGAPGAAEQGGRNGAGDDKKWLVPGCSLPVAGSRH